MVRDSNHARTCRRACARASANTGEYSYYLFPSPAREKDTVGEPFTLRQICTLIMIQSHGAFLYSGSLVPVQLKQLQLLAFAFSSMIIRPLPFSYFPLSRLHSSDREAIMTITRRNAFPRLADTASRFYRSGGEGPRRLSAKGS